MSGMNVSFGDKKIKKSHFYKNKKVIKIDDVEVNNILITRLRPFSFTVIFLIFF